MSFDFGGETSFSSNGKQLRFSFLRCSLRRMLFCILFGTRVYPFLLVSVFRCVLNSFPPKSSLRFFFYPPCSKSRPFFFFNSTTFYAGCALLEDDFSFGRRRDLWNHLLYAHVVDEILMSIRGWERWAISNVFVLFCRWMVGLGASGDRVAQNID